MKKLVFFSSFNATLFPHLQKKRPVHPCLTKDWILPRWKIWTKYTLPSILRQKYDDFLYIPRFHPDARRITDPLIKSISDPRVKPIYAFTDEERGTIDDIASKYDTIYHTRIDSDDMYHPLAGMELMDCEDSRNWFYWQRGYIYTYYPNQIKENGKLFIYRCKGSGPFFCHRQTSKEYGEKELIKEISHTLVGKKKPRKLPQGRFIVGITGGNTSTHLYGKNSKRKLWGREKGMVLRSFGINCWDKLLGKK